MNKAFKIVRNSLGQYVVASELAKSKGKTATKALLLSALSALSLSSYASIVRDDVDYQEFRNFAENKGKYQVGAVNIPVYDKSGKYLGTALPEGVPMPDFSVANSQTAVATLINTQGYGDRYRSNGEVINSAQYVGTVAHNTNNSLNELQFGNRTYHTVNYHRVSDIWLNEDINYYEKLKTAHDFATPKLSKMVTSVAGIDAIPDKHIANVITGDRDVVDVPDLGRVSADTYAAIARLGSGKQYIFDAQNDKPVKKADAYYYVTGGSPTLPMWTDYDLINANSSQFENYLTASGEVLPILTTQWQKGSPLITMTLAGDSGSPQFSYNKALSRWELFGFTQGGTQCDKNKSIDCYTGNMHVENTISLFDKSYLDNIINNYQITRLNNEYGNGTSFEWENNRDGTSSFYAINPYSRNEVRRLDIADDSLKNSEDKGAAALDHGRDLYLGNGVNIRTLGMIDQGAGGIYLLDGESSVAGQWVGSGVYVAENATLNWDVLQPEARELERKNWAKNDILSKLGKGKLHVTTRYNEGEISVGEGEVILDRDGSYDPSGYAFSKVELTSGRGRVTLNGENQVKENNFFFGLRGGKLDLNGNPLELNNPDAADDGANIVNHNTDKSSRLTLAPGNVNRAFKAFLGTHETDPLANGELNVDIQAQTNPTYKRPSKNFTLAGGANLNGNLTATGMNLYLQGYETPDADEYVPAEEYGDGAYYVNSISKGGKEYWKDKDYRVKGLTAQDNAGFYVTRNVGKLDADTLNIIDNSKTQLGFARDIYVQRDLKVLTPENRGLYTPSSPIDSALLEMGAIYYGKTDKLGDFYSSLPTTQVNIPYTNLTNNSYLAVAKATLTGRVTTDKSSQMALVEDATWNMNGESNVSRLVQKSGSTLNIQQGTLTAKIESDSPYYYDVFYNLRKDQNEKTANTNISSQGIWQLSGDSSVGNLALEQGA